MASCHSRPGNVVFHKSIVEKIKFVNSQFHKRSTNHLTNHKLFSTQFWNQDLTICLLQNQASVGYKQNFKIHNQILNHATPKNLWWSLYLFAKLGFPQNTRDGKISFYSPPWTRKPDSSGEKCFLRVFFTNWVCILSIRMASGLSFNRFCHLSAILHTSKEAFKKFFYRICIKNTNKQNKSTCGSSTGLFLKIELN